MSDFFNDLEQYMRDEKKKFDQHQKDLKNPEVLETIQINMAKELRVQKDLYEEKYDIKPGMIVTWKSELLRNRAFPKLGEPALVIRMLENEIKESSLGCNDSTKSIYLDIYDFEIMVLSEDNLSVINFLMDSKRFKPLDI